MKRAIGYMMLAGLLSACAGLPHTADPAVTASEFIGLDERQHRSQLRDLVGVDPVRTEWCAAFVNAVLEIDGIPSNRDHRYPLTARAFLDWGSPVAREDIRRGDVVVFPRGNAGWQGHVGFYVETQIINGREYWVILGGNQENSVRYDLYPANRSIGIRRWNEPIVVAEAQRRGLSSWLSAGTANDG